MIDDREECDAFGVQDALQALDRFIHGMMTGQIDDAIVRCGFHEEKNNELKM
jgi:hypothetical protein